MAGSGFNVAKILAMKLKNLILCIINLFKRALCIFRRRTPASPVLPVVVTDARTSAVYDIPDELDNDAASWDSWDTPQQQQQQQNFQAQSNFVAAASHSAYETMIPQEQQLQPPLGATADAGADEVVEPDYFADMTPASFKAPKIVVKKKSPHCGPSSSFTGAAAAADSSLSSTAYSSRLAVSDNASDGLALAPPQELEALDDWDNPMVEENMWADEENEELDWEVEFALRETRRQELEKKKWEQQQRRMQREMQKSRTHSQSSSSASHFQTIQSLSH